MSDEDVLPKELDVLGELISSQSSTPKIDGSNMERNSGHRLLCPSCKTFQRTKIEAVLQDGIMVLNVACRRCGTTETFFVREDSSWMPVRFSERVREYANRRAKEALKDANKGS